MENEKLPSAKPEETESVSRTGLIVAAFIFLALEIGIVIFLYSQWDFIQHFVDSAVHSSSASTSLSSSSSTNAGAQVAGGVAVALAASLAAVILIGLMGLGALAALIPSIIFGIVCLKKRSTAYANQRPVLLVAGILHLVVLLALILRVVFVFMGH